MLFNLSPQEILHIEHRRELTRCERSILDRLEDKLYQNHGHAEPEPVRQHANVIPLR
jgi:hypothetical protein